MTIFLLLIQASRENNVLYKALIAGIVGAIFAAVLYAARWVGRELERPKAGADDAVVLDVPDGSGETRASVSHWKRWVVIALFFLILASVVIARRRYLDSQKPSQQSAQVSSSSPPSQDATKRFSTKGHPKAKGASFSLEYPGTWIAREGPHPNIVQMFASNPGEREVATILTTVPLPPGVLVDDLFIKETLSEKGLKAAALKGASISRIVQTTLQGKPAGVVEYAVESNLVDAQAHTEVVALVFFQGQALVHFSVQVITPSAGSREKRKSNAKVREMFQAMMNIESNAKAREIFQAMMNSIVFEEK